MVSFVWLGPTRKVKGTELMMLQVVSGWSIRSKKKKKKEGSFSKQLGKMQPL